MEESKKKIKEILKTEPEEIQKKILLETAVELGSEEWKESVKDLMRRLGMLK